MRTRWPTTPLRLPWGGRRSNRELIAIRHDTLGGQWETGSAKRGVRLSCTIMGGSLPSRPCGYSRTMERTSCDVLRARDRGYLHRLLLLLEGATTNSSTADTNNWTKLRRLHYHPPEHVSACLGSVALWGGYDDDSTLRVTRDD